MKVIKPTAVTDAVLTYSSVTENDHPEWDAGTNYTIGTKVARTTAATHRIYESVAGGVDATPPEDATAGPTPKWLDLGPTNKWAMFDQVIGTKTVVSGVGLQTLQVELTPSAVTGGLALFELQGKTLVVQVIVDSVVVWERTVNLDGSTVLTTYDWFFEPYSQLTDVVFTNLPQHYWSAKIKVTITGNTTVACGVCVVGKVISLGETEYNSSVGIDDYSKKNRDSFGNYNVKEGDFSKVSKHRIAVKPEKFRQVFNTLVSFRAIPCVYVATDWSDMSPLFTYGFFRSFEISVPYPTLLYCVSEVEGLI